jgi:adenosylhomocysteine nucleosidase
LARALALPRLGTLGFAAFGGGRLRVAAVGIGAPLLDRRWAALAAAGPIELAISAGVCGGLDRRLRPGTLVVPERVAAPGGDVLTVTLTMRDALLARLGGAAAISTLATADAVLATAEAKAALRARTGADAVDMESAAIMRRAGDVGASRLVVRGVADAAGEALPAELLALVEPDGRVRASRAVAAVVTSPAVLRDALRLRRSTRRALDAVASALRALAADA